MIIGFTGLKNAGKDTAGAYLVKKYGFERRSFAEPLKRSFAALFDIPFHEIDKLKNEDCQVMVGEFVNGDQSGLIYSEMTFRHALQRYGTESHRDIFGKDFWVDQALPVGGFYKGRKIVVTDVRFTNEADRIKELGGIVCKIHRDKLTTDDSHISEIQLADFKPDYSIINDKGYDNLYAQIEQMLEVISK